MTPIRIEVPRALAAAAISLTWSSNLRMLPGFTRTAAQPASIAAKTYFGWKWMSAITGICECWAISGRASASSWLGHATRTMSQPVAVSSAICWRVAFTSEVSVVVIDWTEIGWSLPTPTLPTWIWRVLRRGASTGGGASGMPRLIAVTVSRRTERSDAAHDSMCRGTTRSPTISTTPMISIATATTYAIGSSLATSTYPGSGRPRNRAAARRAASHSAPAM